ncbi:MAG: tRNA (adenosine(37)-N6)-dimethylallyltransferase MiaA [Candidatus Eiseniibacteriota bacterium]|nr:MAG: tRNA (adenosine(37)-N6)-dimethylallyltransferase MiaA [Candidatus Eisenbacteria bacterium]
MNWRATNETNPGILVPGIVGPTAVGKTGIAVTIAEARGWEIVSADSRQVYKLLDIGTAKPTPAERSRVMHHLVDIVPPWEAYSCGTYRRQATAAMEGLLVVGKVPLVVGGSGLYLRALERGLFDGPERDESIRSELRASAERGGRDSLHEMLAKVDPVSAKRIHPRDTERVIRAIEVYRITGKPISELQRDSSVPPRFKLFLVGLRRPRESLYRLINERFDRMLEAGLLDEVRGLVAKGFSQQWPSFRTVGYRELAGHLRGEMSLDTARDKAKAETRRFAKRQLTWFSRAPVSEWVDVPEGEAAALTAERVSEVLRRAGLSL